MKERPILESWKEISDHLRRSIKTCQRWEIELGLPIHRLDGTPSARVFAYPDDLDRWVKEKLHPRETEPAERFLVLRLKKRKIALATGALFGFATSAGIIWHSFLQKSVSFPASPVATVSFLPFENVTGEDSLEPWRSALPRLFYVDFQQSMVIGVSDPWPGLKKLGLSEAKKFSGEDVRKLAPEIIGDHTATGSLVKSGGDIILNVSLYDKNTGEIIQSFRTISPSEKDIFDDVDSLARKIKLAMGVPPRLLSQDIDEEISRITTDSPEALKLFCLGLKLDNEGNLEEAVSLYKQAAEMDPGFGEAYLRIFEACRTLDACCECVWAKDEAVRAGKKALELSDRLNVWSRSILIKEYCLDFQKNLDLAIVEYRKLLPLVRFDPVTTLQLAQIFYDLEDYDKVIAILNAKKPLEDARYARLLAESYARRNEYAKAEKVLDESLNKEPSRSGNLLYDREVCALDQNKFEEASIYNDRLLSQSSPASVKRSRIPVFIARDDYAGAENELRGVIEQGKRIDKIEGLQGLVGVFLARGRLEEARHAAKLAIEEAYRLSFWPSIKRAHFLAAYVERLGGNLPEALREAELACPCYEKDDVIIDEDKKERLAFEIDDIDCLRYFHLRALINLEMGRLEDFEKQAAEIKQVIDAGQHPRLIRIYLHLLGHQALRAKNFEKAIDYFWKALNRLPSPYGHAADIESAQYFYSLAEAYSQAGRRQSSLDLFKKIPRFWEQKLRAGDLYSRSFYRIAKIYDRAGNPPGMAEEQVGADRALAVENYRKFLGLWKDADPEFAAETEDARQRLAALETE